MLDLNDIFRLNGIAPEDVNVMLHSPKGAFGRALLGVTESGREILEAYQSTHSQSGEMSLKKGRRWVASFLKLEDTADGASRLVFVGLYANEGFREMTQAEFRARPEIAFLCENFGMDREQDDWPADRVRTCFQLRLDDLLGDFIGRLVIETKLTRSYVRLAENMWTKVAELRAEGVYDAAPPPWRELRITGPEMRVISPGWAARLREWRGIYLITDMSDGMRYVGSAYGADNLLGRWQDHVAGDKGVTKELSHRDPVNFVFSILERVSPDMPIEEITKLEQSWMYRLHTKEFGLNS